MIDFSLTDRIATITMDDGKANAISPSMLDSLAGALDRAQADDVGAVVLAGRPGRFSGGFDLGVLTAGGPDAERMVRGGFELAERLLGFDRPVVLACTGHAVAMGSFLLCAADYRVGAAGDFRIQANEVAIGIPMPMTALTLLRHRLTPAAFDRSVGLAEAFSPEGAVAAGFLDTVVDPDAVVATAQGLAAAFAGLDRAAHVATKRSARADLLAALRAAIDVENPIPAAAL